MKLNKWDWKQLQKFLGGKNMISVGVMCRKKKHSQTLRLIAQEACFCYNDIKKGWFNGKFYSFLWRLFRTVNILNFYRTGLFNFCSLGFALHTILRIYDSFESNQSSIFVYLFRFYIKKILKNDCIKFKLERPTVNSLWFLAALLIPLSVIALIFIFVKGKFIVNYDFSQNVKHIIYGLFKAWLCSSIAEEFLFRGFLFTIFENKFNKKAAIVITLLLFASLHLFGMSSFFDIMSVLVSGTLVGVMFSLIAHKTDSIWNAITVHTMRNFVT